MLVKPYPPIRETKVHKHFFRGKMYLTETKKQIVKKGNIYVVEKDVRETVIGR